MNKIIATGIIDLDKEDFKTIEDILKIGKIHSITKIETEHERDDWLITHKSPMINPLFRIKEHSYIK